jgi:hypothetical protein
VTTTTVTAKIRETLNVHGDLAPAITLDYVLFLNDLTQSVNIFTIEVIAVHGVGKIHFIENLPG